MRFLAFLVCASACATPAVERSSAAVVYGEDDREEVYAHPSAVHRAIAESAIVMELDADWIDDSDPDDVRITYERTLEEAKNLCPGEAFAEQIEPGTCSGTLIDPQHILTAAHCVDELSDCDGTNAWVFGFHLSAPGRFATMTRDDVYRCDAVVAALENEDVDYAVVRLERPVVGHTPVNLRPLMDGLPLRTPLTLIGHPNGLPMKIAQGGEVTQSDDDGLWLSATLDAFSGNSGSGVFDDDGNLVALLDQGEDDYVERGPCQVVNRIDEPDESGEGLTYLRPALDAFCATPGVSSPICECDGPCVQAAEGDQCESAEVLGGGTHRLQGSMDGFVNSGQGSCGGAGPDRHWRFTLEEPGRIAARSRGFDTLLYLRRADCAEELICHDDVDTDSDRGSQIALDLEAGTYVLTLDAYDADTAEFELDITLPESGAEGGEDAGAPQDAGTPVDNGPSDMQMDAGASDAGTSDPGGGCSSSGPGGLYALLLAGFASLFRRRS